MSYKVLLNLGRRRLSLVAILFAFLVGGVSPTGLPAQIAPRELGTRNMELVGYNGEVAAKTPELLQLVGQGDYAYIGSIYGPAGLFQTFANVHLTGPSTRGECGVIPDQIVRGPPAA